MLSKETVLCKVQDIVRRTEVGNSSHAQGSGRSPEACTSLKVQSSTAQISATEGARESTHQGLLAFSGLNGHSQLRVEVGKMSLQLSLE